MDAKPSPAPSDPVADEREAIEGVFNFRDLGGETGSAGPVLLPGLVFRADGIHRTDHHGRQRLSDRGIRQVIDLRAGRELDDDGFFDHPGVTHHHAPIVEDMADLMKFTDGPDVLRLHYGQMAANNGAYLSSIAAVDFISAIRRHLFDDENRITSAAR